MDGTEYITLKEAGEISGYSPDYIGQLIRRGKLTGKQVYANVAWVTTKDALKDYLSEKGKVMKDSDQAEEPLVHQNAPIISINQSEDMPKVATTPIVSVGAGDTLEEIVVWDRVIRVVSMGVIVLASLSLIFLFHVLSTLLDDRLERRALERVSVHSSAITI